MGSYVPSDAAVLAGVDCTRLRASPLYSKLPDSTQALDALRQAEYLLLSTSGNGFLVIGRGPFPQAPAGATLVAPNLALAGTPDAIAAAIAQHRRERKAAALLQQAESLAPGHEIWLVAAGSAMLPLSGNWQNLNRLLHATQYTTLAIHVTDGIDAQATAICGTVDSARRLEEELRAMASIAASAESKQPAIAAQLLAIQVNRDDRTVRIDWHADAAGVGQLLKLF
jgi:hypothetical protein